MSEAVERSERSLYERDFYAWTQQQAALLREARFSELDLVNVLDEIESLGRHEVCVLRTCYMRIARLMLEWMYRPDDGEPDRVDVVRNRIDIEHCLEDSPSIVALADKLFRDAYRGAREIAAAATDLPLETFPLSPPFTRTQLETDGWFPASVDGRRVGDGTQTVGEQS